MAGGGFGAAMRRVEDGRFLTGRGRYVDDIVLPRMCHAAIVASVHAHARILEIDSTEAAGMPGVLCVLTGADAAADGLGGMPPKFMPEDAGGPPGYRTFRPILAPDVVRCVGDRVALVVAETAAQARDAAERVEVRYEILPAVVTAEKAVQPGAQAVWEGCPGNVSFTLSAGDAGATEAAFRAAPHVVRLRLRNNRVIPSPLEVRNAIGEYEATSGSYILHTSTQVPHAARGDIAAHVLRVPETKLRVVSPDVGGGFGVKADCYPEDALVLWAARRAGRPVKWLPSRSEAMAGDNHARDQVVEGALALDGEGRILAMRAESLHNIGCCVAGAAPAPLDYTLRYTPGVYDIRTLHLTARAVFTHTAPLAVYRGPGRAEGNYLIERLLDAAAFQLGIDRIEIRRRNAIPAAAMPYATQTGSVYDSGDFARMREECLARIDWNGFEARRAESAAAGRLRGRALIHYIEHAGISNDRMELRFDPSGAVTVLAGTHSHGQGHATTYAQLAAEFLGIPFESVAMVQGDTGAVAFGRGTYAARSSQLGGVALRLAADRIIAKARARAAFLLEVAEADLTFGEGRFSVAGTDRGIGIVEVAKSLFQPVHLPDVFDLGLEAHGTASADIPNYPNGCHACEVEVDPETGAVRIARYAVVDDVGRAINPMICEGQIHGAIAQGVGQALMEHAVYGEDGQLLSGSLMDYCLPRADDFCALTTHLAEIPATTNPLGIKGVGESGTIGAPPALMNAIIDALRPLGVADMDMPATPFRVWQAIAAASAGAA